MNIGWNYATTFVWLCLPKSYNSSVHINFNLSLINTELHMVDPTTNSMAMIHIGVRPEVTMLIAFAYTPRYTLWCLENSGLSVT